MDIMLSPSDKDECLVYSAGSNPSKDLPLNICVSPPGLPFPGGLPIHPILGPTFGLGWPQIPRAMEDSASEERTMKSDSSRQGSPGLHFSSARPPSADSSTGKESTVSLSGDSGHCQPNPAIKFSIESILSRPDRVRKADDEGDVDQGDDSSDILVNVHDCSSDELKDETREETSNLMKDAEENCYSSERYSWLQCTRYKPPKLPRSKKKEGVKKRKLGRNPRVPFTQHQVNVLEQKFRQTHYLSSVDVAELSAALNLTETRVKIWFQNRRARERRDREQPASERDASASASDSSNLAKSSTSSSLPSPTSHCEMLGLPGMPGLPGGPGSVIPWPSPALPRPGALAHFSAAYHHRPSAFTPLTYLGYR